MYLDQVVGISLDMDSDVCQHAFLEHAAACERAVHHPPVSRRDAHVRDAAVVAVGEEQQVRRRRRGRDIVRNQHRVFSVLPGVAGKKGLAQVSDSALLLKFDS